VPERITVTVNGMLVVVPNGITVAAAIAVCGVEVTRRSVSGMLRSPLCGMGICQECRVCIDGQQHRLSCQTLCRDRMNIETAAPNAVNE
jgi:hypothetical protein